MDKYKLVGRSYDYLGRLYSGDTIRACKLAMINDGVIDTDTRILFVGAGHGVDAIQAAKLGAEVTVVDISPTMMKQFNQSVQQHHSKQSLNISTLQADILKVEHYNQYDIVVSNFFLNVFDKKKMTTLLSHMSKLCKQDGQIIIGDFCPSEGSLLNQAVQNIYWYTAATTFFALAGNAIHRIYDYRPLLEKHGFELKETKYFKFLGRNLYCSIRAQKRVK